MTIAAIAVVVVYYVVAIGVGSTILQRAAPEARGGLSHIVTSAGAGLGVLSLALMAAGLAGALRLFVIIAVLASCAVAAIPGLRRLRGASAEVIQAWLRLRTDRQALIPLFAIALGLLVNIPQALAPPTDADSLAYHFAVPRAFVDAGHIFDLPWLTAYQPLGQHMHYAAGLLLAGEQGPPLIAYGAFTLLVAAVVAAGAVWFGKVAGLWAGALMLSVPVVIGTAASGQVEIALTFYTVLALMLVANPGHSSVRELALGGAMMGLALGTKYYALISLGAVVLALGVLKAHRRRPVLEAGTAVAVFSAAALIVGCPWYLRNLASTGNPFFPEFNALFPSPLWDQAAAFTEWVRIEKRSGGESFLALLRSPWDAAVHGDLFGSVQYGIGPSALALIPAAVAAAFVIREAAPVRRFLLAFTALFWGVWFFFAFQRARHLLPVIPVLLAVGSDAAVRLSGSFPRWSRRATTAFSIVACIFGIAISVVFNAQFLGVVAGTQSRASYLRNQLAAQPEIEWINSNLTQGDTLAHFNRTYNFPVRIPAYHLSPFSSLYFRWSSLADGDDLLSQLCAMNVTHVAVDDEALKPGAEGLSGLLANHFTGIVRDALRSSQLRTQYEFKRNVARFRTLDRGEVAISARIMALDCRAIISPHPA